MGRPYLILHLLPVLSWRHSFHSGKELAESSLVGKMKPVGNLGNAQVACPQKKGGFHEKELVHIVHNRTSVQLSDYT